MGDHKEKQDIFLSHSGKQKSLAEHLYDELRRANQTVFLDKHTLPIADPFPSRIKRALHDCKLGVLVLSDDFLTSKWPMLELQILFEKGTKMLPLFYRLTTEDLKSSEKISTWRKKWKTMERNQEQADQWEKAVNELHIMNGIVYHQQQSETAYINKVVSRICNFIRPQPIYDQSLIRGAQHLAEVPFNILVVCASATGNLVRYKPIVEHPHFGVTIYL